MNRDSDDGTFYRKKLFLSVLIPGFVTVIMWMVWISEVLLDADLSFLGIYPLTLEGLPGIIISPLLHADIRHLYNNTVPLFLLATGLFYFYSEVALRVFSLTWIITGLLVWLAGREAWHIGASGLIYGIASFLFFSGILGKYYRLAALSLLVVFLYGSMVWGIFPGVYKNVSWESHMLGFVSGIILSVWFRNDGPKAPVYEWMNETEETEAETENSSANDKN